MAMKDDGLKKLIEKYKEGNSTLKEEQFLFNNNQNLEPSLKAWYSFIKQNRKETPNNFNDSLWKSFQNKKIKKRRLIIGMISAVASVLLLISLFVSKPKEKEFSYSDKEILLNQALNMFSGTNQQEVEQNIIYENEIIIIYTTTD